MGKRIRAQRIGRGSPTYRAKSWRRVGKITLPPTREDEAIVIDVLHDPGRNAPVAKIRYKDGQERLILAPEGIRVGNTVKAWISAPIEPGSVLSLAEIPEGTFICNIEAKPNDGGKFVRSSGTYAILIAHDVGRATVQLPSGEIRDFNPHCRATIGVVAGGGRKEKPFLKAGKKHYFMLGKGKHYPRVRGVAMNVVDHPFGGGRRKHAGRPKTVGRTAPPGQKVGLIAARRTGKR